jgi:hypothetical protein
MEVSVQRVDRLRWRRFAYPHRIVWCRFTVTGIIVVAMTIAIPVAILHIVIEQDLPDSIGNGTDPIRTEPCRT